MAGLLSLVRSLQPSHTLPRVCAHPYAPFPPLLQLPRPLFLRTMRMTSGGRAGSPFSSSRPLRHTAAGAGPAGGPLPPMRKMRRRRRRRPSGRDR